MKMMLASYICGWAFVFLFHSACGYCGPPPFIPNTKPLSMTSGTPGQILQYACNRAAGFYEIPGKSTFITCQYDNTWSYIDEFCTRGCVLPERLHFAEPDPNALLQNLLPGTKLSYRCRPGYLKVPGSKISITCLYDYTWSISEIFCHRKSCGHPGEVDNGNMEATDFLFGSRVTYTCNKGYRLLSSRNYRDCQADGTWSNSLPYCDVVICPPPRLPNNVQYYPVKNEYSYLDALTLSCQKPLKLVGSSSIACTAKGEWSSTSSMCKEVSCGDPGNIPNGRMSALNFLPGSTAIYTCNEGYAMISGSSYRYCQADGTWNGTLPVCKASKCDNIWELQEEAKMCTLTPDEWLKYLQIQNLYLQIENLKLDIDIKKMKLNAEKKSVPGQ